MAKRMAPLLENIVDPAQAAFVGGRLMTENIYLAQELLRQYNRKRISPRCLLKIDLRKAYDSVSWDFLRVVLEGLRANLNKSSLYTAGINGQKLVDIHRLVNMPIGSMLFKYLGIPLAAEKLKAVHYASLVEKIAGYINAWANCTLTYAGRMELIRSVVQGVECFWLSILPILSTVIDRKRTFVVFSFGASARHWLLGKTFVSPRLKEELASGTSKLGTLPSLQRSFGAFMRKGTLCGSNGWTKWTTQLAIDNLNRWFAGENSGCSKAYDFFRPRGNPKVWTTDIWRHYIPPKHSFILWLGIKGRLQTKDRLHYMDIDRNYALCGIVPETLDHLFFQCNMTKQVWLQIKKWLRITRAMSTIKSALKYMKKEARESSWQSRAKKSALACTVYHIWTARNRRLFEGTVVTSDDIIREIKTQVYKIMFSLYPHVFVQYEHLALGH
ncbi:hypothetical protein DH2020_038009 [Rehmannia glutinosa]|uniref:Reverse transcriptase zinc-binding domain-containing protein n=1 Tax=Rehmannia glutinosa TaxID=99300 RepID=A0ABR0V1S4_REHGL